MGFFSQSGALSITLLAAAAERGLGLSTFVSAGNRADLSGNDVLQYWQTDPATEVVLLYLESFGNPRKFTRLARRLARTKPIVAVKSGRLAETPTTLASTTAPLDEGRVQALFEHSGVIRVQNVPQMFDVAQLLAYQPLPAGGRVAVVGNSTALNLLVVDALDGEDLVLTGDPVDAGTTVSPEGLAAAVGAAGRSDDVDALVVVFVPPLAMPGTAHAEALREAVAGLGKPVVTTFLGTHGMLGELAVLDRDGVPVRGSVPSYPTPERAVEALRRVVRYARWRTAPPGETVRPPRIDVQNARALVDRHEGEREHVLDDEERVALLRHYGIKMLPFRRVGSAAEAVTATLLDMTPCISSSHSSGVKVVLVAMLLLPGSQNFPRSPARSASLAAKVPERSMQACARRVIGGTTHSSGGDIRSTKRVLPAMRGSVSATF
jgi:acyl-CoA synthetase (NDP forming)